MYWSSCNIFDPISPVITVSNFQFLTLWFSILIWATYLKPFTYMYSTTNNTQIGSLFTLSTTLSLKAVIICLIFFLQNYNLKMKIFENFCNMRTSSGFCYQNLSFLRTSVMMCLRTNVKSRYLFSGFCISSHLPALNLTENFAFFLRTFFKKWEHMLRTLLFFQKNSKHLFSYRCISSQWELLPVFWELFFFWEHMLRTSVWPFFNPILTEIWGPIFAFKHFNYSLNFRNNYISYIGFNLVY